MLNRLYTQKIDTSPYNLFYGKVPNLRVLKTFGATGFAHNIGPQKFSPRSFPVRFLGYAENRKAYIVQRIDNMRVMLTRSLKLNEHELIVQLQDKNYNPAPVFMDKEDSEGDQQV